MSSIDRDAKRLGADFVWSSVFCLVMDNSCCATDLGAMINLCVSRFPYGTRLCRGLVARSTYIRIYNFHVRTLIMGAMKARAEVRRDTVALHVMYDTVHRSLLSKETLITH